MDHYEMVEKLRERMNVSYEEARAALEASNWDLLDAMVYLESSGRTRDEKAKKTDDDEPCHKGYTRATDASSRVLTAFGRLIGKGNENYLVIARKDTEIICLPLTALVILILAVSFWWFIPVIALLLIFGYRITFKGPNTKGLNNAVDKAASAVRDLGHDKRADDDKQDE